MSNNSSSESTNILYSDCRENWSSNICAFANVSGLISTGIFLFMYLPQIYRNFRYRSVQGLSPYWIIANFTAAINNLFFVFKHGNLPLFTKIGGVYSPMVHFTLLFQIFIFTPYTRNKFILFGVCLVVWVTIVLLQSFLSIYNYMQWVSVVLWSVGGYPQVILNMKRQSTQGLSELMVGIRTVSTCFWFFSTFLLVMPSQNYILCYFSGTGGYLLALQVIMFWKQPPRSSLKVGSIKSLTIEDKQDKIESLKVPRDIERSKSKDKTLSKTCNVVRWTLAVFILFFLASLLIALLWSFHTVIVLVAPVCLFAFLACFHFYYTTSCCLHLMMKVKHLFNFNMSSDLITVKK